MKRMLVVMIVVAFASFASANLTINGDFDGNADGWDFFGDSGGYGGASWVSPHFDAAYVGWNGENSIYQTTAGIFQADTVYTLTVVGAGPDVAGNGQWFEGMQLVLFDSVNGDVATFDYMFPAEDATAPFGPDTPGNWRTAILEFDTSTLPAVVGEQIGVGVRAIDSDASYGWMYVQSVALVPEPATMVMLGLGSLVALRRKK